MYANIKMILQSVIGPFVSDCVANFDVATAVCNSDVVDEVDDGGGRCLAVNGEDDDKDDSNDEAGNVVDTEVTTPVLTFCICEVFITADTANLALAESRVNRDVGCDEKE